jgi:hypothetical protein
VIALTVRRPGDRHPSLPVRVHLIEDGHGRRIVGVAR